jgi:hypothetical protein
MRKVAFLLLIGCGAIDYAASGLAAETWKWKDANGVVHYSDKPVQGAERISVLPPKPSISVAKPAAAEPRAAGAANPESNPANQPAIVPYTRCVITSPDSEETFNAVNAVAVSMLLEPALQEGHHIEVQLNGNVVKEWPQTATSHTLTNLERGSYTVSSKVLDSFGGAVCSGPAITFYVRLPTVPQLRAVPH